MGNKTLKYLTYALFLVTVVIAILFLVTNKGGEEMVSTVLTWAYILLAVAIFLALLLFVTALTKGGNVKKMLGVIIAFVVLLIIAYLLASGKPVEISQSVKQPTAGVLKMTDTSLIMSIILLVGAVLAAIGGGLIRRIKN